jgi:hypothetical protein
MVGSYEESILRGRMSTTPSKPLNFLATIGVLGLGNCKPNLKCPPHVSIPFPAVFYNYSNQGSAYEDGPSPYVGQIDIQNSLKMPEDLTDDRKRRRHATDHDQMWASDESGLGQAGSAQVLGVEKRRAEKKKRRSASPKAPPGGCYRIPQRGQIQIVIKNPNKTAVKLFLVPYDLQGMEPGTKTFLRQRSYSTGPVLDTPISSQPETAAKTDSTKDRPTLRYLIHLHICSPSRDRFYLYKSIRVVFANRVPDGKERLRNEIQLPDPRFSIYKPERDSTIGLMPIYSGAGLALTAEKSFRRRSSGFPLASGHGNYDAADGIMESLPDISSRRNDDKPASALVRAIPFNIAGRPAQMPDDYSLASGCDIVEESASIMHMISPIWEKRSIPSTPMGSPVPNTHSRSSTDSGNESYDKLSKGDVGYGGKVWGLNSSGLDSGEGLLARRLKGLDVQMTRDGFLREKDGIR